MKILKYLWVLSGLFFIAAISVARADGGKTIIVTNNTSFTMTEFYASPSVDSSWENTVNLLAGQAIAPGQTTTITIADGIYHCHYDLMGVLYGSAEHAYQYSMNACRGESWTVHY
jgi:hypothetical protein